MFRELFGLALLLLISIQRAFGQSVGEESKDAERGAIGALVVLVFLLYRKLVIAQTERNMMLAQLQNETKLLRESPTSQTEVREELCRLSSLISDALGKR